MRRSEREVKNETEILEIVNGCKVLRLGMVDAGRPYVVPLNFGYTIAGAVITIYLHCAKKGRKLEVLAKNNKVCIEMDRMTQLITGESGCDYSCNFESLIGEGQAVILTDEAEKIKALNHIMKHQTGRDDFSFEQRIVAMTTVIAVALQQYSVKRH
ncbi:pyridoxamine 5'-phosphate oxidase family protein [uncultured Acetobacterium sp.]|uniref:pyridoxamine 5'-phosphate oxidase family protein n=1 Tax=uncultured Acetobacterium sp. TaxID=217139 RepID=UPI002423025D|nr:pyridoxamine 5'-phosphate oxidase family protein [uncultured Acetobacterium sp.]MBU4540518.1 pyridoxamine 5'-phosphate oxidase family protein [Bacillota bacterium]